MTDGDINEKTQIGEFWASLDRAFERIEPGSSRYIYEKMDDKFVEWLSQTTGQQVRNTPYSKMTLEEFAREWAPWGVRFTHVLLQPETNDPAK